MMLSTEGARLILPSMPDSADRDPPPFEPAVTAPPIPHEVIEPERITRTIARDVATGDVMLASKARRRTTRLGELTFGSGGEDSYAIPAGPSGWIAICRWSGTTGP
jgi:hypothetical protein